MNSNNGHMFENPTTEFSFCLYDNGQSEKNCTSGLFSSLPLQSRQTLWTRIFGAQFQNITANDTTTSTENLLGERIAFFIILCVVLILVTAAIFIITLGFRLKHWRKKWTRDNMVTIPNADEDLENLGLLRLDTESKLSCNSGETSSTGYASDMYDDTRSNVESEMFSPKKDGFLTKCLPDEDLLVADMNNLKKKYKSDAEIENPSRLQLETERKLSYSEKSSLEKDLNSAKRLPAEESVVLKQKIAIDCEKDVVETSAVNLESVKVTTVKLNETKSYNVEKMNVIVLQSPNKMPGQEDSPDHTDDPLPVQVSTANNSHLDLMRLHWSKIFSFLMKQIFPSEYRRFFSILLENAGCRNAGWVIESVACDTTGKIDNTVFTLLQRWKDGAWPNAKPKDIEDVFETLEWNAQLNNFREYMRNPPYSPEGANWNEHCCQCISSEDTIGDKRHLCMHQITIPQIQGADDVYDRQAQTNDIGNFSVDISEHVSVANKNEIGVFRHKKLTCHRSMVRRNSDDSNGVRCTSETVECRSVNMKECIKLCRHKRCRNICEVVSKKGKDASFDTKVSFLTNKSCMPSLLPSLSSFPTTETSTTGNVSSPSQSSSGYGSMSSNIVEQEVSTNIWNGGISEDTFSQYEDKTGLSSNSNSYSETSESQQDTPTLDPCQTEMENLTENQNENPCRCTFNSWHVSSAVECPLFTSNTVVGPRNRKQNRNDNKKHALGMKKKMVSKKRPKSYRRKSTSRMNRKMSGEEDAKSAYLSSLTDTFIEDLLARMIPSREDVLSLKFQSYSDGNCFVTTWNERIFSILSEKLCLYVRQREWKTMQRYVNKVRNVVMKNSRKQHDRNREFLFLNHNGEPLI
ncbi:uncharacterized protein LOC123523992 [Mercenaria mercenaria]|uniref:uncharacterized protein LOC123523992 n=1 Tax=Mercenaria mercenaria TaxID=6596 RepID=UPI00234E6F71|nr:uncharacterized protein LOC123523992 [Mercenaria mercenaria]